MLCLCTILMPVPVLLLAVVSQRDLSPLLVDIDVDMCAIWLRAELLLFPSIVRIMVDTYQIYVCVERLFRKKTGNRL